VLSSKVQRVAFTSPQHCKPVLLLPYTRLSSTTRLLPRPTSMSPPVDVHFVIVSEPGRLASGALMVTPCGKCIDSKHMPLDSTSSLAVLPW